MLTPEQQLEVDNAELKVQRIYVEGADETDDLLSSLEKLQRVYANVGLISNKVTMVNSALTVLRNFKTVVFMSEEERTARREEVKRQKEEADKEALKEELYQQHLAKQNATTASKKKK